MRTDGNVYAMGVGYFTLMKWTTATDTWSTVVTYPDAINVNPFCWDPKRGTSSRWFGETALLSAGTSEVFFPRTA